MKPSSLAIRALLLDKHIRIFTTRELGSLVGLSSRLSTYYLNKGLKEGLFLKLKNGLYALKTDKPGEGMIANALYRPSYVSMEYALAYYSIIPEMVYTVTSVTTKPTREFGVGSIAFSYMTIKREAYTGYQLVETDEEKYTIADPEKALADYLYFVSLGKKTLNDRLNVHEVKRDKLKQYAELFGRSRIMRLVEEIYDQ